MGSNRSDPKENQQLQLAVNPFYGLHHHHDQQKFDPIDAKPASARQTTQFSGRAKDQGPLPRSPQAERNLAEPTSYPCNHEKDKQPRKQSKPKQEAKPVWLCRPAASAAAIDPKPSSPPPSKPHKQHQRGTTLAIDRKTHRIGTAKSQQCRKAQSPTPRQTYCLSQGACLKHHHNSTKPIGQPGKQSQRHSVLPNDLTPETEQAVINRRMGVIAEHCQQIPESRRKLLSTL